MVGEEDMVFISYISFEISFSQLDETVNIVYISYDTHLVRNNYIWLKIQIKNLNLISHPKIYLFLLLHDFFSFSYKFKTNYSMHLLFTSPFNIFYFLSWWITTKDFVPFLCSNMVQFLSILRKLWLLNKSLKHQF